jgi:hypothetical protein
VARSTGRPAPPDVLQAFDPLASAEEKAAQDAWAGAEGLPPPVPEKPEFAAGSSTLPPLPASASVSTAEQRGPQNPFPAIASFARSLTSNVNINSLVAGRGRSRPGSMDFATAIQTPTAVGSFAAQQDRPQSSLASNDDAQLSARGSPKLQPLDQSRPGSGTASPLPRTDNLDENATARTNNGGGGKDGEPQFDFQRFLDQMKLKSSEPVAKYLRSYVPVMSSVGSCMFNDMLFRLRA